MPLHNLSPHTAHKIALSLLKYRYPLPYVHDPHKVFGIDFPNRLGLSAGFDKNGVALKGLYSLGFGHVEVGTMTLGLQTGHKSPILERVPNGLVNRLGLPNDGVNTISTNIKANRPKGLVVGGSIAFGDFSSPDYVVSEVYETFTRIKKNVDYVVLNASCPNVETSANIFQCLNVIAGSTVPVLVKLRIIKDQGELRSVLDMLSESNISGVVCSNTLPTSHGGLSGEQLTKIGHQQLEWVKEYCDLPVISSGGVMSPQDAVDRIRLGADLVQVYTGFVYGGLRFPYRTAKAIKDI